MFDSLVRQSLEQQVYMCVWRMRLLEMVINTLKLKIKETHPIHMFNCFCFTHMCNRANEQPSSSNLSMLFKTYFLLSEDKKKFVITSLTSAKSFICFSLSLYFSLSPNRATRARGLHSTLIHFLLN